jgi:hypothetical protein
MINEKPPLVIKGGLCNVNHAMQYYAHYLLLSFGLQKSFSVLPLLTYPKVRCAAVLEKKLFRLKILQLIMRYISIGFKRLYF